MKRVYHWIIVLTAVLLIAGCAGSGKKSRPDTIPASVKLPETVPESFSYRITDRQSRKIIMDIEADALRPAERLKIKLLQQLASIEHADELDAAFDRVWDKEGTLRKIVEQDNPPAAFIPPLALSYFMLTYNDAYNWRDKTGERLYEGPLKDIEPRQLGGYPLHFYTLALLRNGSFAQAWPFLKQLEKKTTPAIFEEDLKIALASAAEKKDPDFAGKILPLLITTCRQHDMGLPEEAIAAALESFKASGKLKPVALAMLSSPYGASGLKDYSFYKYLAPYAEGEQWQVLSTSADVRVVFEKQRNPGRVLPTGKKPKEAAYNWLMDQGFVEGRNIYKGKLLYISVGAASVNAKPGHKDYIDSRYLAFQRAELAAKAKTAIYFGVDLTTERGSMERSITPAERAGLRDIYETSAVMRQNARKTGITDRITRMLEKSARLNEARLDQALKEAGVDVEKQKRRRRLKNAALRDRMQNLRSISDASLKAAASAFAEVQGTQIIQAFEGAYHGNYQVVVITLWSKNLNRLVKMMEYGTAPMPLPKKDAKEAVIKQLPDKDQELACLTGVRAYINEKGEHVLLGFGQAGVKIIAGRADKAYERAENRARLRAMAAFRNFMGERIAFKGLEELREVLALYAGGYGTGGEQEYHAVSRFSQMITAQAQRQKIHGIYSLCYKELVHPFTGRPMVLKVLAWSPGSRDTARDVKRMIERTPTTAPENTVSAGEGADADAW